MSTQQCKSTCVSLLRNSESSDAEPRKEEVLLCLHGKADILDAILVKSPFIEEPLTGVSRQGTDRPFPSLWKCNNHIQYKKHQYGIAHLADPSIVVEYVCKTQTTLLPKVQSCGLSLHISPGTHFVNRWRPGSILLYFISLENLPNGCATLECIREGMVQATNEWHRADINISFQETQSRDGAAFTVTYDAKLPRTDFAQAFFPGDSERIIRIGPLAFDPAHVKHISKVLSHELGHVLALRYDSWEDAGEGKGQPAWYFPSKDLNHSSIMNHRNALKLSLLVVGDRDRDEGAGSNIHVLYDIDRMKPRICQRAPDEAFEEYSSCPSANNNIMSPLPKILNEGNRNGTYGLWVGTSDDILGLCDELQCTKHDALKQRCQTQRLQGECEHDTRSIALGFNTNSSGTSVFRWAQRSTLHYYVDQRGLSKREIETIQDGMRTAAGHWQATGLGVTFKETSRWQDATFTIAYNPNLSTDHYAVAFFPGWQRKVIDIGARLLNKLQYVTEVLGHELGHILGLRHEFWEDNRESGGAYQYPSDAHDEDSIMNDRNVGDMSRFTISPADEDAIRRFYDLRPGQHSDIFIQDLVPRPAVECLGLVPVQITQTGGSAPAIRRQSVP